MDFHHFQVCHFGNVLDTLRVGSTPDSWSKCFQTHRIHHQVKYWIIGRHYRASLIISVCAAGTDTVSQFQFLEAVASKIPAKWRKVGLSLGISSCVLDGIEKHRRGDCLECFSDVFTCWQQQSTPQSPVNWATLVTVLQSNYVGEEELSDTVRNMFIWHWIVCDYVCKCTNCCVMSFYNLHKIDDTVVRKAIYVNAKR